MKNLILGFLTVSFVLGCAHTETSESKQMLQKDNDKFVLKVALYPWIPEPNKFAEWVETKFESEHPDIDLVVRTMSVATDWENGVDLAYNLDAAAASLANENFADQQHIVEVDTLILGELAERNVIQPFSSTKGDFYDFTRKAVTYKGEEWGIPHWTCGYFLMTTHPEVSKVSNAIELKNELEKLDTVHPDLGGYLKGSWTSLALYLDSYVDTFPNRSPSEAVGDKTINPTVLPYLRAIGDACDNEGESSCDDWESRAIEFGGNKLDALIGYSERLHISLSDEKSVLKANEVLVTPAPLGGGKTPYFFTDALVLSKNCETKRCKDASSTFADFYVRDDILAYSMMGKDYRTSDVPRYLLPATKGALQSPIVSEDPIYSQLSRFMEQAIPYPNSGVPAARETVVDGPIEGQVQILINNER